MTRSEKSLNSLLRAARLYRKAEAALKKSEARFRKAADKFDLLQRGREMRASA